MRTSSPRLMISTREIYEDFKKFCLSNCCVVFLSAVPVVYRSWQAGRLGASGTLTGVTWRGAVKALGWPLPALDV